MIDIQRASVLRSGRRILDNITLQIPEGQHVAILGPNGSGKSSLIKLITCRYYPLTGAGESATVKIFGRDRWDISALQQMMGILSSDQHQSFAGDTDLIGVHTVLSGFFASKGIAAHHSITSEMHAAANAALTLAGASHLTDKKLAEMSTGEVRRVLIARALVNCPRALLLDEPTTGLDIAARSRFLSTVRDIAQSGTTVILVTHHVEEIIPEIDRVIMMQNGKIFRDGVKQEVLSELSLSELFQEPVRLDYDGNYYRAATG